MRHNCQGLPGSCCLTQPADLQFAFVRPFLISTAEAQKVRTLAIIPMLLEPCCP